MELNKLLHCIYYFDKGFQIKNSISFKFHVCCFKNFQSYQTNKRSVRSNTWKNLRYRLVRTEFYFIKTAKDYGPITGFDILGRLLDVHITYKKYYQRRFRVYWAYSGSYRELKLSFIIWWPGAYSFSFSKNIFGKGRFCTPCVF